MFFFVYCSYGNDLCFFDVIYKIFCYVLLLFFLCVKINVNYIVVGVFVVQMEFRIVIFEVLGILIKWNFLWIFKYFMVDFSEFEI